MSDATRGVTRREALKRGVTIGGAAMVWAAPATQAFAMSTTSAQATSAPAQGCTPGYWRNHLDSWPTGIDAVDAISEHFGTPACTEIAYLFDRTMLEGLQAGGGRGLDGATKILLRAAIAAFLNANHSGVSGFYGSNLLVEINGVLTGPAADPCDLDRDAILALASALDKANNAGCPLN